MPLSQSSVGSGSPFCRSGSQPLRYAPSVSPLGHLGLDSSDDGAGVGDRHRPDVDQPIRQRDRLHQRVPMRLDQPRQRTAIADVDDVGVGPDERFDVGPAADGCYSTVGHCHRLRGGLCVVDGQNCSVDDKFGFGHTVILLDDGWLTAEMSPAQAGEGAWAG